MWANGVAARGREAPPASDAGTRAASTPPDAAWRRMLGRGSGPAPRVPRGVGAALATPPRDRARACHLATTRRARGAKYACHAARH